MKTVMLTIAIAIGLIVDAPAVANVCPQNSPDGQKRICTHPLEKLPYITEDAEF